MITIRVAEQHLVRSEHSSPPPALQRIRCAHLASGSQARSLRTTMCARTYRRHAMSSQICARSCFARVSFIAPGVKSAATDVQGAANVRCSQCQHVTPVAPNNQAAAPRQAAQPPRAQLQCAGCQIMLMYPRGAANVQCAVCGVVSSAAQVCVHSTSP